MVFNTIGVTPSPYSWCSTPWEWFRLHIHGVKHHRSVSVSVIMVFNTLWLTPSPTSWCSTPWEWFRLHIHGFQRHRSDSVSVFMVFNTLGLTPSPNSWCSTPWKWFRLHIHGVQHHGGGSVSICMVFNTLGLTPSPISWCSTPWEWLRPHLHEDRITPIMLNTLEMGTKSVPETLQNLHTLTRLSAREHFIECGSCPSPPNGPKQEGFIMLHASTNRANFLTIWFVAKARRQKNFQSTCQFKVRFS